MRCIWLLTQLQAFFIKPLSAPVLAKQNCTLHLLQLIPHMLSSKLCYSSAGTYGISSADEDPRSTNGNNKESCYPQQTREGKGGKHLNEEQHNKAPYESRHRQVKVQGPLSAPLPIHSGAPSALCSSSQTPQPLAPPGILHLDTHLEKR